MANIWREPIFDRTSADVAFAIHQIAAWKEKHTHATDVSVEVDRLVVQDEGEAYVQNDALVLRNGGVTLIEDDALIVQFGTTYDLKGCLNLSDLTRIEDDIEYLASRLTKYGYPINSTSKEWMIDSLPTVQDMERICNNLRSIHNGFARSSKATNVPTSMLSYEDINALEYNLNLLKQMLDAMESSFIESGTYISGATLRLPTRR